MTPEWGMPFPDDEFTEVTIISDQHSPLGIRDLQDFDIRQSGRVLAPDSNRIVTEALKMWNQAHIAALIEQKPHAPNDALVAN